MAKILSVDDEPQILELERSILENEGYEIIIAHDGKEALEILKKEKPDMVMIKMMMPGMSRRELCEKIRENKATKKLKAMFVTVARFSEVGKEKLEKMNVLDYVTKPFENDDFLARVKKAMN